MAILTTSVPVSKIHGEPRYGLQFNAILTKQCVLPKLSPVAGARKSYLITIPHMAYDGAKHM